MSLLLGHNSRSPSWVLLVVSGSPTSSPQSTTPPYRHRCEIQLKGKANAAQRCRRLVVLSSKSSYLQAVAIFQHSFSGTVVAAIGERSEPRFTLLDSPLSLAVSFEWFEPIIHFKYRFSFRFGRVIFSRDIGCDQRSNNVAGLRPLHVNVKKSS